jgi:hypothetical protein
MKFDWIFQELMKFEQEAHVCAWKTNKIMEISLRFQNQEFLD